MRYSAFTAMASARSTAQQLIVAGLETLRMNTCGAHYRDELEAVREAVDQRLAVLREVANLMPTPWRNWYSTQRWRKRAAEQIRREPRCRYCGEPARHADHVKHHRGDPHAFWHGELQSLCPSHHSEKTRKDEAELADGRPRYMRGCTVAGWPLDPRHHWNRR
jgi:5-methylcytosine-specific restriction enzyme A